jgi:hypothetical protein
VTAGPVKSLCERCCQRPIEQWPSEALAEFDGIFVCLECWDLLTGRTPAPMGRMQPYPPALHIPAHAVAIGPDEEPLRVLAQVLHWRYGVILDLQDCYPHGFYALVYTGLVTESYGTLVPGGRLGDPPIYEQLKRPYQNDTIDPDKVAKMRRHTLSLIIGDINRRR